MKSKFYYRLLFCLAVIFDIILVAFGKVCGSENGAYSEVRETIGMIAMHLFILLPFSVTLLAWFFSMDKSRKQRSSFPIFILFFLFALCSGIYVLFLNELEDDLPSRIVVGVTAFLLPMIILFIEWVITVSMARLGSRLQQTNHPAAASRVLNIALALRPQNQQCRYLLGMMLTKSGKYANALPIFIDLYDKEKTNKEFLEAYYESSKHMNRKDLQLEVGEALETTVGRTVHLDDMISLWLESKQPEKVFSHLIKLSDNEQEPYLDILFKLYLDRNDTPHCLEIADRIARKEGKPYTKALATLQSLIEKDNTNLGAFERIRDLGIEIGDMPKAIDATENILRLDAKNEYSRRILIDQYRKHDQLTDIIAQLKILDSQGKATGTDLLEIAQWYYNGDKPQKAIDTFERIKEDEIKNSPEALLMVMHCLTALGKKQEAIACGAKALKDIGFNKLTMFSSALPTYLRQNDSYQELRQYTETLDKQVTDNEIDTIRQEIDKEPDNIDLRFKLIENLCKAAMYSEAVISYDDLFTKDKNLETRIMEHLRDQITIYNNNARLANYLIDLLERKQEWQGMLDIYKTIGGEAYSVAMSALVGCERILRKCPNFTPAIKMLIELSAKQDLESKRNCLTMLDNYYRAGGVRDNDLSMSEFCFAMDCDNIDRAIDIGEDLYTTNNNDVSFIYLLSQAYAKKENFKRAIELHEAALHIEGKTIETNPDLLALKRQYLNQQVKEVEKQIEHSPNDPQYLDTYGDLMNDLGNHNKALAAYQKASQKPSEKSDIYKAKYAFQLLLKGPSFYSEAQIAFKEAVLQPTQDESVQNDLKAIFYRAARLVCAEQQWDFALELFKRIFRVDASYKDTVSQIDRIEGILRSKKK